MSELQALAEHFLFQDSVNQLADEVRVLDFVNAACKTREDKLKLLERAICNVLLGLANVHSVTNLAALYAVRNRVAAS